MMGWISWPVERIESEMRRLRVLQYLLRQPDYEAGQSLLVLHCRQIGVPTTRDQMSACIGWLAEQELVSARVYEGEPVARLTTDGRAVAEGSRSVPGVLRPDP